MCMMWVADCCYVAGVMACLDYARTHARALHLPVDIRPQTALPMVRDLCAAAHRVVSQTDKPVDLLSLLPGSPRSPQQRDLSGGVMERRRRDLAVDLPDAQRRAVLRSAGGQFAGHWVQAVPVADSWRARPRLYQLALCMRLGVPIPELAVAGGVLCTRDVVPCMTSGGGTRPAVRRGIGHSCGLIGMTGSSVRCSVRCGSRV